MQALIKKIYFLVCRSTLETKIKELEGTKFNPKKSKDTPAFGGKEATLHIKSVIQHNVYHNLLIHIF